MRLVQPPPPKPASSVPLVVNRATVSDLLRQQNRQIEEHHLHLLAE